VRKENCYKELSQGRDNAAVDNNFYSWTVLVYFEKIECRGTERDRYYEVKNDVNTLRKGSFKLFKRPFPGFLIILTL